MVCYVFISEFDVWSAVFRCEFDVWSAVFRCEFDVWSALCLDVSLMCGLLCV